MKQTASVTFHFRRMWRELAFHGLRVPMTGAHVTKPVWKHVWRGDYEAPELMALAALVRPQDRVLELGAGMGLVSGVIAKRNPTVRFLSYEANPAMEGAIRALHATNGIANISLRPAIVASLDQGPTRRFRLHRNFTEGSLVADSADQGFVEVAVDDPSKVMAEFQPDILLCDIEGGEEELIPLLDMRNLRAAVIELHPKIVSRAGMKRIFEAFLAAQMVPVVELSTETVVAFEAVRAGDM
jgi:FkbM family methyltransferase